MYFIGVTTAQSSINAVFPRWAERLELGDCALRGLDFRVRDDPARYRAAVDFIKHDPLTRGALVTTHKVDVFTAGRDQFDAIEPLSAALGEISSIYKRDGRLLGRAVDPWTIGHALAAFLPVNHWQTGAEALVLGAGGSGTALAWHLANAPRNGRPACIHVADKDAGRLAHLGALHAGWGGAAPLACHLVAEPRRADALAAALPPHSLVVNATGLGKDAPGSPLTPAARFPEKGFAWDFNYRGDLGFLRQARVQPASRELQVVDGWVYFLHGWLRVIADVFNREIPTGGPVFEELGALAAAAR